MRLPLLLAYASLIVTALLALWVTARLDDHRARLSRIEMVIWGGTELDW